jgi:ribosomal protein S18 acetylase RimI-like enzyme
MYNHQWAPEPREKNSRAKGIERNRWEKKALVETCRSHGVLVYAQKEPVGWCQFGLSEELPRIEKNPKYRKPPSENGGPLWRITCFVVRKKYRRRGVARTALRAALTAIHSEGGGLVEAFPVKQWGSYQKYRGTVSMFEREGFQIIAPLGESNVLMRKTI